MAQIFYNEKIYGIIETDVNNYIIQSEMKEHNNQETAKKENKKKIKNRAYEIIAKKNETY